MPRTAKVLVLLGALSAATAVSLGAFGAHALKAHLESAGRLQTWQTAVLYHLVHSLGLLIIGIIAVQLPESALVKWAGWLMVIGVVLFFGSLYVLCLTRINAFGAITPFGGTAFIIAWVLLAMAVFRAPPRTL